jgi:hypothetical protein
LDLGSDVEVLNVAGNVILGAVSGTMLVSIVQARVAATFFFFFGGSLSFLQNLMQLLVVIFVMVEHTKIWLHTSPIS